jgi:hypothetical protein
LVFRASPVPTQRVLARSLQGTRLLNCKFDISNLGVSEHPSQGYIFFRRITLIVIRLAMV